MNTLQAQFLLKCRKAAAAAGHPFPGAAAAEAWTETGGVHFPPGSNNCLGIKAFPGYKGESVPANGTEEVAGALTAPSRMRWRAYASFEECFADQLRILRTQKNGDGTLRYQAALAATTAEEYILAECPKWSTNSAKAKEVLDTYHAHRDLLA